MLDSTIDPSSNSLLSNQEKDGIRRSFEKRGFEVIFDDEKAEMTATLDGVPELHTYQELAATRSLFKVKSTKKPPHGGG